MIAMQSPEPIRNSNLKISTYFEAPKDIENFRFRAYVRVRLDEYYLDDWGDISSVSSSKPEVSIFLSAFKVTNFTPQGAWILADHERKFVLNGNGKRYAYEKPEWALKSLLIRQRYYKSHLHRKLQQTNLALEALNTIKFKEFSDGNSGDTNA